MKLIEGMKQLKIIEKKMAANSLRIGEYAAIVSTERPAFSSADEQKAGIKSLIQSNRDLAEQYLALKRRVDLTNLNATVAINGRNYTIVDLLVLRRGLAKALKATFLALREDQAQQRLGSLQRQFGTTLTGDKTPHIERMYEEREKHEEIQKIQNLEDEIETRLETINAVTELVSEKCSTG